MKLRWGKFKLGRREIKLGRGESKLRRGESKLKGGEFKLRGGEIKLRRGEFKRRRSEFKLRGGEIKLVGGEFTRVLLVVVEGQRAGQGPDVPSPEGHRARTGQVQLLLRARHRHVCQPPLLLLLKRGREGG
eukprot:744439-Pyramimonas_sp.AAC.1